MVSVITACFNSEKTIARAIESLLNQSNLSFEHIVVDGKSSDNTLAIVESFRPQYEERGIKLLVVSEKDDGLYDALNKGISLSRGEFVGILNADDWYEKETINIIDVYSGSAFDVVMGATNTINGTKVSKRKSGSGRFITSRHFNHGSMFVKRKCYQEIGCYANDGNYYDDFMWYVRAVKCNKSFKILDDVLYNFVCGGMSTKKSLKETIKRIKYRYACYRVNNCSRFYIFECVLMEFAKLLLVKGK